MSKSISEPSALISDIPAKEIESPTPQMDNEPSETDSEPPSPSEASLPPDSPVSAEAPLAPVEPPQPAEPIPEAETGKVKLPERRTLRLPNATVGRDYLVPAEKIELSLLSNPNAVRHHLTGAHFSTDELGLRFENEPPRLIGSPLLAGEHRFELRFALEGSDTEEIFDAALTINPDPTSLWKNIPSPQDAPYYKTEQKQEEQTLGGLRILAASQRGRSHAHEGSFRDDDFDFEHLENDWWLAVISDGAGSAKYSRQGSLLACESSLTFMREFLSKPENPVDKALQQSDPEKSGLKTALYHLLPSAAFEAHKAIEREAQQPGPELPGPATLRDYAATLILLALKKTPQGWFVATFSIGDGGAGWVAPDGTGSPLTQADSGEFAGQTQFVTMANVFKPELLMARIETHWIKEFQAIVLMTDGITDPKFPSDSAFADPQKWKAFWEELQTKAADSAATLSAGSLLTWMGFPSPGNHDDRTLMLILPVTSVQ